MRFRRTYKLTRNLRNDESDPVHVLGVVVVVGVSEMKLVEGLGIPRRPGCH
jgi:hypothetical protein